MALRQRLLRDIAEMQTKPYPNISFIPYENDITKACLILTPNGGDPVHLTVKFGADYPLRAPVVTIQSWIYHPNVFGDYICASILNTDEGYTPAYDLKGIAIQILSFFSSDSLEQAHGGPTSDLTRYRGKDGKFSFSSYLGSCAACGFDGKAPRTEFSISTTQGSLDTDPTSLTTSGSLRARNKPAIGNTPAAAVNVSRRAPASFNIFPRDETDEKPKDIASLPDEILCLICNALETEELMVFAQSWNRIGSSKGVVTKFNLIRNRELLCFCLKKSFENTQLGVGVFIEARGRQGMLSSEFDLLSLPAFEQFKIRHSVQGLPFDYWLPLPLSRRHYNSVRPEVSLRLHELREGAKLDGGRPVDAIFCFMNDIVVKLSTEVQTADRSALGRASEKAIESYFHLFHLLLCQATEDDSIVRSINRTLQGVIIGRTSKQNVPNLGHLLISVLISDADMTQDLLMAIIRETVTRNVVWMLDSKGAGMMELAYMEADTISQYRLQKTFEASKTSYRLLMFLNLFRRTINRGAGQSRKSLVQMRDELFDAHGAPPRGTAAKLANDIKELQQVDSFPKFLVIMGLKPPAASQFTTFLRNCMEESVRKGYSVWGVSQERALTQRRQLDPNVQVREDLKPEWQGPGTFEVTFFPNRRGRGAGRGGLGAGRGRGGRGGRGF